MGTNYNPSIITNGLVVCLDAANPKSYPGTGTAWNDLSGNGLNATIGNSPTYSSSNGGILTYAGANSGATATGTSSLLNIGTGDFTAECWAKPSNISLFMLPFSLDDNLTGNGLIFYLSSSPYNFRTWVAGTAHNSTAQITNNTWYHLVISRASGTVYKYINGVLDGTHVASGSCSTGQTVKVAWRYDASYNFSGPISKVSFYNTALNANQVLQNYNAVRGRFGL